MNHVVVAAEHVGFCQLFGRAWFKLTLNGANENLIRINIFGIDRMQMQMMNLLIIQ